MDGNKFDKSVERFRKRMESIQSIQRVTQRLPDHFVEQPLAQGKRMRLTNTTTQEDTQTLRPCHPPTRTDAPPATNELPVVIYPQKYGGTALFREDLDRLQEGVWLHDRIINVILKWAYGNQVSPQRQQDIQLCDSFMFSQLTFNVNPKEVTSLNTALKTNFERVRNYRRNKGPGNCPITMMPICEDNHWFILFVLIDKAESTNDIVILIADSYPLTSRIYVAKIVQMYLEYTLPGETTTQINNIAVTRQRNGYDCGLHVVHNALRFMQETRTKETIDHVQLLAALNRAPVPISRHEIRQILEQLAREHQTRTLPKTLPDTTTTTSKPATTTSLPQPEELKPEEEELLIPPTQIVALDALTVLENKTDSNWIIYSQNLNQLQELVSNLKTEMKTKSQRRLKKLGYVAEKVLSLRMWNKSGFTRIVCIGDNNNEAENQP